MGYKLLSNEINSLFEKLKEEYKIYAPKRFVKQGRYSDTDIISGYTSAVSGWVPSLSRIQSGIPDPYPK